MKSKHFKNIYLSKIEIIDFKKISCCCFMGFFGARNVVSSGSWVVSFARKSKMGP